MHLLLAGVLSAGAMGQVGSAPQAADVPPGPPAAVDIDSYCHTLLQNDPHAEPLQKACISSLRNSQTMPNYLCEMNVMKRGGGELMQQVATRVRVIDGIDSYEDLKIDGKRTRNQSALLKGNWSNGELRLKLLAVFKPGSQPRIHFLRETKFGNMDTYEFSYAVASENNSVWPWTFDGKTTYPGYEGTLVVAKSDGHILQLVLRVTEGIPKEFPVVFLESATEFSYVDFKDGTGLMLPFHVLIRTTMRSTLGIRHEITFKHCKKFAATSKILPIPAE